MGPRLGERLTLIHAGDIHLGAPFRGLRALSPAWADRLVHAIPDVYDRVIQACVENQVDFLLLCGDVFDTDKPKLCPLSSVYPGAEASR